MVYGNAIHTMVLYDKRSKGTAADVSKKKNAT
jgi:hypothetical protein